MMMKGVISTLRKAHTIPAAKRSLASVIDGLDLNLPAKFGHFINGEFVEPLEGQYFDNVSPIDGQPFIKAARGTKSDIDAAVAASRVRFEYTRPIHAT